MCGCGRTSMPRPAGSRAGPNSSTKMNGPTIVRCFDGSARFTLKSPRSCVTGAIVWITPFSMVAIRLSRGCRSDRQCVDSAFHQIAEGGIDHALPLHTVFARERRAFDLQREVTLAFRIVAAVAAMLLAVVGQLQPRGQKRRTEASEHFSCDRSSF